MIKTNLLVITSLLLLFSVVRTFAKSEQAGKPQQGGIHTIVIDAGHGGKDPGCSGNSNLEKKIALNIAKRLANKIRTNYPEMKVILTRDKDVFVPLYERAAIANRNHADLFISIHCNAMPPNNEGTRGTETYVMGLHTAAHNLAVAKRENASILLEADYEKNYDYDPNSPEGHIMLSMYQNAFLEQSILIADLVEQEFQHKDTRKSRGVKQAGFVVLKETTMPSILVETGFLTNRDDELLLASSDGQDATAESIFQAFISYKNEVESGLDSPITAVASAPKTKKTTSVPAQPRVVFTPKNTKAEKDLPPVAPYPNVIKKHQNRSKLTKKSPYASNPVTNNNKPTSTPTTEQIIVAPIERPNAYDNPPIVHFKVQMAVTSKPIDTGVAPWNQNKYLVEVLHEGNQYKYQARNFSNFQQALKAKNDLRRNGFPDAFIVAYRNGKRIPINEAKKLLGLL